jgi:hypothetical protein
MNQDIDWKEVGTLVDSLYGSVDRLQSMFAGRKFTLDGHLVGSLGEVIAAYMFDLELNTASMQGHDAIAHDGRQVEIKFTQGKSVAIRHEPAHLLVLQRLRGKSLTVVFNGSGEIAWQNAGKLGSNGQRPISITKLKVLDSKVSPEFKLPIVRPAPI